MANSSDLSGRIEDWDREVLAALIFKHRPRIMRRIRGKLRAIGVTAMDEEDIFSTCARRLDLMCMDRRLQLISEDELVNYIFRMAMNIATNQIRAEHRRQKTLHRLWRQSLPYLHGSLAQPDQRMIDSLLLQLHENDRELLQMRLNGLAHAQIAKALGISMPAERSRWQRLRMKAKALLAPPPGKVKRLTASVEQR